MWVVCRKKLSYIKAERSVAAFVFTDLLGGSVNNGFFKRLGTKQFHLITNTSLGLLMDCSLMNPDADELRKKLGSGEFSAVYCNDLVGSMGLEDDDF